MKPKFSDFVPTSLVETDKYIEVADGYFLTSKQTGEFQINMRDNNCKTFIATLYNVLFTPDLSESIIFISYVNEFGAYLPFF